MRRKIKKESEKVRKKDLQDPIESIVNKTALILEEEDDG